MNKDRLHIRLPAAQKDHLARLAANRKTTTSELARQVLGLYLDCHLRDIDPQRWAIREFLGLNPTIKTEE